MGRFKHLKVFRPSSYGVFDACREQVYVAFVQFFLTFAFVPKFYPPLEYVYQQKFSVGVYVVRYRRFSALNNADNVAAVAALGRFLHPEMTVFELWADFFMHPIGVDSLIDYQIEF